MPSEDIIGNATNPHPAEGDTLALADSEAEPDADSDALSLAVGLILAEPLAEPDTDQWSFGALANEDTGRQRSLVLKLGIPAPLVAQHLPMLVLVQD